jgi:hypothetical protein
MDSALVFTIRSLRECLDRRSTTDWLDDPDALSDDLSDVVAAKVEGSTFVIHRADTEATRRIFIPSPGQGRLLPIVNEESKRAILERIYVFAQRTEEGVAVHLPPSWGQYKVGKLVAFFACPRLKAAGELRWFAEPRIGPAANICFGS